MQCLILAGGLGKRLRPITQTIPKTLVEVAGMPFAHHQLSWLARQGVRNVVYSLGYLGEMVRDFVGDGSRWGLSVSYADEGMELKGTAGAIRLALDKGLLDSGFLVLYGDSFLPIDILPVWIASDEGQKPLMTVFRNDDEWDKSNVRYVDGIVELYEKGRIDAGQVGMRHIDYGMSVLTRSVIDEFVSPGKVMDLAAVFYRLSIDGRLLGFEISKRFYEVGSHDGLADLEAYLSHPQSDLEGQRDRCR
ncbi:MAG: nucleotidyl transferase [Betaproteobacteria bacterium]|nr:MAG: nucleotidyl transferase [Betaproteobacteria bacterium]